MLKRRKRRLGWRYELPVGSIFDPAGRRRRPIPDADGYHDMVLRQGFRQSGKLRRIVLVYEQNVHLSGQLGRGPSFQVTTSDASQGQSQPIRMPYGWLERLTTPVLQRNTLLDPRFAPWPVSIAGNLPFDLPTSGSEAHESNHSSHWRDVSGERLHATLARLLPRQIIGLCRLALCL